MKEKQALIEAEEVRLCARAALFDLCDTAPSTTCIFLSQRQAQQIQRFRQRECADASITDDATVQRRFEILVERTEQHVQRSSSMRVRGVTLRCCVRPPAHPSPSPDSLFSFAPNTPGLGRYF